MVPEAGADMSDRGASDKDVPQHVGHSGAAVTPTICTPSWKGRNEDLAERLEAIRRLTQSHPRPPPRATTTW